VRAGVRFDGARCIVVLVNADGSVAAGHEQTAPDAEHGVPELLGWLARHGGDDLRSVTFDVSTLLRFEDRGRILAIRVSPRPAVDDIHELGIAPELTASVRGPLHLTGGHDMRGRALAGLALDALDEALADLDPTDRVLASVSAVGSIANPEHEQRVADAIFARFPDARVSLSHEFYSSALRDRDFTATANVALLESGERLAGLIESAASVHLPGVEVAFGLNDGGRAPIRRLGATPVHAVRAARPLAVQGARQLAGFENGELVLIDEDVAVIHVHDGVPAVQSVLARGLERGLASNWVRIDSWTPALTTVGASPAAVVVTQSDRTLPIGAPEPTVRCDVDLIALGAAVAPLSSWADFLAHASTSAELDGVLRATEEELRTQATHWGAAPDDTRVVESSAYTTAYGSRNVIRIRVRVIGDGASAVREEARA
jgi:hypothetical protein